jgi:hypothetical protein
LDLRVGTDCQSDGTRALRKMRGRGLASRREIGEPQALLSCDFQVRFVPKADIYELGGVPAGQSEHNKKSDNVGHHDVSTVAEPRAQRFYLWMLVR